MIVENQLARIITMIDAKDIDMIIETLKNFKTNTGIQQANKVEKKSKKLIVTKTNEKKEIEKFANIIENEFSLNTAFGESELIHISDNSYELRVPYIYRNEIKQKTVNTIIMENSLNLQMKITIIKNAELKFKENPFEDNRDVRNFIEMIEGKIIS